MKIAVLSGKGGTGKTFISVNLAYVNQKSRYIDCDTEEPNGHLFLKPEIDSAHEICVKIPVCDNDLCDGCQKCVEFCRFNALAYASDKLIIFDKICHSCGGCTLVCPTNAIYEIDKPIGRIEYGKSDSINVRTGILNTGEVSGIPIIDKLLSDVDESTVFIDCPPGSSCAVMESIKDADYCLVVAEPSVFGTHNLEMVHNVIKLYDKPCGAVLNKCTKGENPSYDYCINNGIPVLASIDFDPSLAYINSKGEIAARHDEKYNRLFIKLTDSIMKEVRK